MSPTPSASPHRQQTPSTNSQPHRILGNAAFHAAGAWIIAAAEAVRITQARAAMASSAEAILGQPPGTPDRLIKNPEELDLGGVTLRIRLVGTAHTPGSLVVDVVEDWLVFAGDVLYGGRLAVLPESRTDGWITAFDRLRAFDDAWFVPGHGPPGPLGDFEPMRRTGSRIDRRGQAVGMSALALSTGIPYSRVHADGHRNPDLSKASRRDLV